MKPLTEKQIAALVVVRRQEGFLDSLRQHGIGERPIFSFDYEPWKGIDVELAFDGGHVSAAHLRAAFDLIAALPRCFAEVSAFLSDVPCDVAPPAGHRKFCLETIDLTSPDPNQARIRLSIDEDSFEHIYIAFEVLLREGHPVDWSWRHV